MKNVLATLWCRRKGNAIRRNVKVGGIVLLKKAATERNSWSMGKIAAMNAEKNRFVRSVEFMLGASGATDMAPGYLERPVNKLVMLVENE